MAERKRSQDGSRDTDAVLDQPEAPTEAGRAGGEPARQVASADELKQATKDPAGRTRVTKSLDEEKEGGR